MSEQPRVAVPMLAARLLGMVEMGPVVVHSVLRRIRAEVEATLPTPHAWSPSASNAEYRRLLRDTRSGPEATLLRGDHRLDGLCDAATEEDCALARALCDALGRYADELAGRAWDRASATERTLPDDGA